MNESEIVPSSNGSNGRDDKGRFLKGNDGGPGNPHASKVAKLRAELLATVTVDDLRRLVRAMLNEAHAGNVHAAMLLLSYLVGKPVQSVELSGPDKSPITQVNVDLAACLSHFELFGQPSTKPST